MITAPARSSASRVFTPTTRPSSTISDSTRVARAVSAPPAPAALIRLSLRPWLGWPRGTFSTPEQTRYAGGNCTPRPISHSSAGALLSQSVLTILGFKSQPASVVTYSYIASALSSAMPAARCTLVPAAYITAADNAVAPPSLPSASSTMQLAPACRAMIAAHKPAPPPPIITTSKSFMSPLGLGT
jgi:hypothetical protein